MKYVYVLFIALAALPGWSQTKVKNGPTHEGYTMEFQEKVRFGSKEESDDYLWSGNKVDFAVTNDGRILVSDNKTMDIRLFSPKGEFLKKVASKGEGPGELRALSAIQILEDGRLVVFEQAPGRPSRFSYFDKNFKFIESANPSSYTNLPVTAEFTPSGERYRALIISFKAEEKVINNRIAVMKKFDVEKELSSFNQVMGDMRSRDPKDLAFTISGFLQGAFAGIGVACFDNQNRIYTAHSKKYEITRWSPDFKTAEMVIEREYKPIAFTPGQARAVAARISENFRASGLLSKVTDSFIERVMDGTELPQVKGALSAMVAMPDGHLLVVSDLDEETGRQVVDIFNPKGKFIGQFARENWSVLSQQRVPRMIFRNNQVYCLETNEDDDNTIAVYDYKLRKQ